MKTLSRATAFVLMVLAADGLIAQSLDFGIAGRQLKPSNSPDQAMLEEIGTLNQRLTGLIGLADASVTPEQVAMLHHRRSLLRLLLGSDPRRCLDFEIPENLRQQLPMSLRLFVEHRCDIVGTAGIRVEDDFQNGTSRISNVVYNTEGQYEIVFLDHGEPWPIGGQVEVQGLKIGSAILADSYSTLSHVQAGISESYPPEKSRVLALLVDFLDSGVRTFQAEDINRLYFPVNSPSRRFYRENSYGKFDFEGTAYGWFRVPRNGQDDWQLTWEELATIVDSAKIDLAQYDCLALFINHPSILQYYGSVGSHPHTIGGKTYQLSDIWMAADNRGAFYGDPDSTRFKGADQVFCHEVGHTLGCIHANALVGTSFGENVVEYGNLFDVMGTAAFGTHFNARFKEELGWLDSTSVLEVSQSGVYAICPLEATAGYRAVRIIAHGGVGAPLYAEYRQALGFDSAIAKRPQNQMGLMLNTTDPYIGLRDFIPPAFNTHAVDCSPADSGGAYQGRDNITLNGDSVYRNALYGVTIGPILSQDTDSIRFAVQIESPLVPQMVTPAAPASNATVIDKRIRFAWHPVSRAESYEINLSRYPSFSSIGYSAANIRDTSITIDSLDSTPVFYYWRVRGFNASGAGPWCAPLRISVEKLLAMPTPTCLSPVSGSVVNNDIRFRWSSIPIANSYDLKIWSDQGGGPQPVVNVERLGITDTTYLVQGIETTDWLYFGWSVRGVVSDVGVGEWASPRFFWLSPLTTVTADNGVIPKRCELLENYPNPFNPVTKIGFRVSGPGARWVRLAVYDLLGREIAILVDEPRVPGNYEVQFPASWQDDPGLSSGVYLYRMNAGSFVQTRRLVLLK